MSGCKDFIEKALEPIRIDAETQPEKVAQEDKPEPSQQSVPPDDLERRYVEVMNGLLADARERKAMGTFVEVVSWKLAVVAYHWGPRAAGLAIRRLGAHMEALAEEAESQSEANAAKDEGHLPH